MQIGRTMNLLELFKSHVWHLFLDPGILLTIELLLWLATSLEFGDVDVLVALQIKKRTTSDADLLEFFGFCGVLDFVFVFARKVLLAIYVASDFGWLVILLVDYSMSLQKAVELVMHFLRVLFGRARIGLHILSVVLLSIWGIETIFWEKLVFVVEIDGVKTALWVFVAIVLFQTLWGQSYYFALRFVKGVLHLDGFIGFLAAKLLQDITIHLDAFPLPTAQSRL